MALMGLSVRSLRREKAPASNFFSSFVSLYLQTNLRNHLHAELKLHVAALTRPFI